MTGKVLTASRIKPTVEMRDTKNSTPQISHFGNKKALIKINQQQFCCWLVTIELIVGQILPD
ncbi:MAG: hypothetical protein V7K38_06835 [Nostoc sp.]|uniref:hypothetical protein n=1 Tax=Nostoc sp. TaxID=1180 RepID=UPI002FF49CAB